MKQTHLFPNTLDKSDTLNLFQDLDRSEVEPLASKILETIRPFCVQVEVAGSFRRGKSIINDLDFVVQPYTDQIRVSNQWLTMLKKVRSDFDAITEKQGDKLATLYLPFVSKKGNGHVQIDFYRADPTTWGILLLVRTGSKEHNVKLCKLAIQKGLRLQYSVGLVDQTGRVVAGRSEEQVFQALGLPFIAPEKREVEEAFS
jgi:DNA polymerase (family 10)